MNPATEAAHLSLRASASGHLLKRHVQVAMYSFPLSVFGRGPTPYGMPNLVMSLGLDGCELGSYELGVGTFAFVTGLGHLQYISFLNLLHFVPSKVCSTDWVIVASLEDLLFLLRFYHLYHLLTLAQGNIFVTKEPIFYSVKV